VKANILDMLAVLADEADEEDDSGCGRWLARWELAGWVGATVATYKTYLYRYIYIYCTAAKAKTPRRGRLA